MTPVSARRQQHLRRAEDGGEGRPLYEQDVGSLNQRRTRAGRADVDDNLSEPDNGSSDHSPSTPRRRSAHADESGSTVLPNVHRNKDIRKSPRNISISKSSTMSKDIYLRSSNSKHEEEEYHIHTANLDAHRSRQARPNTSSMGSISGWIIMVAMLLTLSAVIMRGSVHQASDAACGTPFVSNITELQSDSNGKVAVKVNNVYKAILSLKDATLKTAPYPTILQEKDRINQIAWRLKTTSVPAARECAERYLNYARNLTMMGRSIKAYQYDISLLMESSSRNIDLMIKETERVNQIPSWMITMGLERASILKAYDAHLKVAENQSSRLVESGDFSHALLEALTREMWLVDEERKLVKNRLEEQREEWLFTNPTPLRAYMHHKSLALLEVQSTIFFEPLRSSLIASTALVRSALSDFREARKILDLRDSDAYIKPQLQLLHLREVSNGLSHDAAEMRMQSEENGERTIAEMARGWFRAPGLPKDQFWLLRNPG